MTTKDIFLFGEIDDDSSKEVIEALLESSRAKSSKVNLYINCSGGEPYAALAIYDVIKSMSTEVTTICSGKAFSSAVIVLVAGEKVHITKNSTVMIHQVYLDESPSYTIRRLKEDLQETISLNKKMIDVISLKCNKKSADILSDLDSKEDMYLSAKESLRYGIVDKII